MLEVILLVIGHWPVFFLKCPTLRFALTCCSYREMTQNLSSRKCFCQVISCKQGFFSLRKKNQLSSFEIAENGHAC